MKKNENRLDIDLWIVYLPFWKEYRNSRLRRQKSLVWNICIMANSLGGGSIARLIGMWRTCHAYMLILDLYLVLLLIAMNIYYFARVRRLK